MERKYTAYIEWLQNTSYEDVRLRAKPKHDETGTHSSCLVVSAYSNEERPILYAPRDMFVEMYLAGFRVKKAHICAVAAELVGEVQGMNRGSSYVRDYIKSLLTPDLLVLSVDSGVGDEVIVRGVPNG